MHTTKKLGFWGLVALIFGLMVGVGIFNLPQNMALTSSVGAVIVAWLVTAAGMLTLVFGFKILGARYPHYRAGIYEYAQEGFGEYAGFNAAWGYWLCTAFSNITYAVLLNDTVGVFFPTLLRHGWETVVFGSVLIWVMYFIVAAGIKTAKIINTILAFIKVLLIAFIIYIFATHLDLGLLKSDIWGHGEGIGGIGSQIKGSMMVTLFCFFGVEGAVMMSARAKRQSDVGKAGFVGFVAALVLYMLVSVLCFGLMSRARLAGLPDPSVAYVLKDTLGEWAYYFVAVSVIIALLGGWVAWTMVVAQVPYEAAKVKILPKMFLRTNRNGAPTFGLLASSVVMEIFLLIVVMADNVYMAALHVTGLMILPCYLFTAMFMWKTADRKSTLLLGVVATLFCCWMIYAGGLKAMLMTSVFYLCGVWFFITARRENGIPVRRIFTPKEKMALYVLSVASVVTLILLAAGVSPF